MSSFLSLNWKDLVKGLFIAFLSAFLTGLYQALTNQSVIDLHQLLMIGATAGLGYLIKNLFTDDQGKLGGFL